MYIHVQYVFEQCIGCVCGCYVLLEYSLLYSIENEAQCNYLPRNDLM